MADQLDRLTTALADRYRVERELGAGGMATVYLAEDLKHRRQVAIKVMKPELAAVMGAERFLREIEIAARLQHPHILPVYDSGNAGGFLYYVMPFVEGESLRQRLGREKQLPVDDALQIASEVGDALRYAHVHDLVHRDIKPENIMLTGGHAVVTDFGIARAVTGASSDRLTGGGVALGTPQYMSPEQSSGSDDLDGRSDLYSLACVLHEMLAGQPPFTGVTIEAVTQQHLTATPPPITSIRPAVPADIATVLARALSKAPVDRFRHVGLFVDALSRRQAIAAQTPTPPMPVAHRPWHRPWLLGAALFVLLAGALLVGRSLTPSSPRAPAHARMAIAVLPFQNLSTDGPYGYFAGGLHDELLTQLAKVGALTVMGRTSVMAYAGATRPVQQIADELGVGSVVEGTVQVVGDRLRVNVQLLDAETGGHLWAETYDRTLDDAFAIQSDVAQRIVAAVGATLGGSEQRALATAPTEHAGAYQLYLQGQEYWQRPGDRRRNLEAAQQLYERALALDATFALAHAALSEIHGRMWWFRYDPSPERLVHQREEAEIALRLAPELPQAHVAMGRAHYHGRRDWRGALDEYHIALEGLPNDAQLWARIGYAHRRLGNWDEVLAAFDRATLLDPRNANLFGDLGGGTLLFLRRYAEAAVALREASTLAPDVSGSRVAIGWDYVVWEGALDTLRAVLDDLPMDEDLGSGGTARSERARLLLFERKPDSVLALLRDVPRTAFEGQVFFVPTALYAAWAHTMRGDSGSAAAAFDSARVLLDSVVEVLPDDWRVHAARGLALAGLGARHEALREARRLEQSPIYRDDVYGGDNVARERARILAQAGDAQSALDELERLLRGPSGLSVPILRLDPLWDPIRDDPRFQALLVKYDPPQPVERGTR